MNMQNLVTNPWFGIIGFVVGFISVAAIIVTYLLSVRPKAPVYYVRSSLLIDKQSLLRGLKILLNDQTLDRDVVFSTIAIWNRGTGVITRGDMTNVDPLRIQCADGVTIHDAWIVRISSKANQPTIMRDSEGRIQIGGPLVQCDELAFGVANGTRYGNDEVVRTFFLSRAGKPIVVLPRAP